MDKKRIIVGISGASGAPLAVRFLKTLATFNDVEIHVVASPSALLTAQYELDDFCSKGSSKQIPVYGELSSGNPSDLTHENYSTQSNPYRKLAHVYHDPEALDASISSGSFKVDAMVIIPCSMKTVAGIASGYADNLLLRAADVSIKEKRPLVLVARESPLSPIHFRNLEYLSTLPNVHIVPPMLTYYSGARTIEDMEDHLIGKILSILDLEYENYKRWQS